MHLTFAALSSRDAALYTLLVPSNHLIEAYLPSTLTFNHELFYSDALHSYVSKSLQNHSILSVIHHFFHSSQFLYFKQLGKPCLVIHQAHTFIMMFLCSLVWHTKCAPLEVNNFWCLEGFFSILIYSYFEPIV